jgi:hypothetical protein
MGINIEKFYSKREHAPYLRDNLDAFFASSMARGMAAMVTNFNFNTTMATGVCSTCEDVWTRQNLA